MLRGDREFACEHSVTNWLKVRREKAAKQGYGAVRGESACFERFEWKFLIRDSERCHPRTDLVFMILLLPRLWAI